MSGAVEIEALVGPEWIASRLDHPAPPPAAYPPAAPGEIVTVAWGTACGAPVAGAAAVA